MIARRFIGRSPFHITAPRSVIPSLGASAHALTGFVESHPAWPPYRPIAQTRRTDRDHYRAFSGPYTRDERWMMENAIADLQRTRRHFRIVRETSGRPDLLSIFVR